MSKAQPLTQAELERLDQRDMLNDFIDERDADEAHHYPDRALIDMAEDGLDVMPSEGCVVYRPRSTSGSWKQDGEWWIVYPCGREDDGPYLSEEAADLANGTSTAEYA